MSMQRCLFFNMLDFDAAVFGPGFSEMAGIKRMVFAVTLSGKTLGIDALGNQITFYTLGSPERKIQVIFSRSLAVCVTGYLKFCGRGIVENFRNVVKPLLGGIG